MSISTDHTITTRKSFSAYYSLFNLVNFQVRQHFQDGPFRYILRPRDPQENKSVVTGFKLEIWFDKSLEGEGDLVTNLTCMRAEEITGTVGAKWTNKTTGSLGSEIGEWGCTKLSRDESDEGAEVFKLFELWTEIPLYLQKGTESAWKFGINLLFHLPGPLQDQVRIIDGTLSSPTNPGLSSPYNNIAQHLSRPTDLCLNASSRPEEELPYVYRLQEVFAAASPYLGQLVESGNDTFATRSFDGRIDFDPVDDDSDNEEDTKRYDRSHNGELSRDEDEDETSEAPEPADKERDEEEVRQPSTLTFQLCHFLTFISVLQPPAKKSKSNPDEEDSDEDEEDQEMAPAAPLPGLPPIMNTRAPHEGMMVINVPHCALSTLQAVAAFATLQERHIVFAFVLSHSSLTHNCRADSLCHTSFAPQALSHSKERRREPLRSKPI